MLQQKPLTLSISMYSVISIPLFRKGVRISRQGMISTSTRKLRNYILVFREKQLLCMARAILKRTKVLVMDEVRDFSRIYRIDVNNIWCTRLLQGVITVVILTRRGYSLNRPQCWLCNWWTHWQNYKTVSVTLIRPNNKLKFLSENLLIAPFSLLHIG